MSPVSVETLPGYRRRIRIEPRDGVVLAMLEDDIHGMAVTLRHDGDRVVAVEPRMHRAPWSTCPGARDRLVATFAGRRLAEVTARIDKRQNCTHLHDLAVLAAAHAGDRAASSYEILVSDPAEGERILELRRDGAMLLHWIERDGVLVWPAALTGRTLFTLRAWIAALPEAEQEAARLLQWAAIVAHGRTLPIERQSTATDIPPNCYTFQPEQAGHAVRNGIAHDFSDGSRVPLAEFGGMELARLDEKPRTGER